MQDKTGWKAHDAPLLKAAIAPASRLNTRGSELSSPSPDHAHPANEQVTSVTLPKIFREIGRRVAKSPKVPAVLKHHMDAIAELKPAVEAKDPAAVARLAEVYAALGKDAYEKFGDKAVPKDIAPHLTAALEKHAVVTAQAQRSSTPATNRDKANRFPLIALASGGLALAAFGVAVVMLWSRAPFGGRATGRKPTNAVEMAAINAEEPAVAMVLGKTSDKRREHGWAGVDLGWTYAQVDKQHRIEPDRIYPWVFRSTRGSVEFAFDENDVLRACTQVVNGGVVQHGDVLLEAFGQTPYDEITRVTSNSKSMTTSKCLYYVFPPAEMIAVIQFSEIRFVNYGRMETMDETRVTVVDLPWAMPILVRSAKLKRPLLEWMREAADTVAAGSYAVDALPDVPGTATRQAGKRGEQFVLMLDDKTPDDKRPRAERNRRIATVQYLPSAVIAAMPGRAGLNVDFENYGLLAGDVFLKGDIPENRLALIRGEALMNTPGLAVLDDEITRVLLQEYFPPEGGQYRFEASEPNGGAGQYRWTSKNQRGDIFEVICSTNGSSSVYVVGTR